MADVTWESWSLGDDKSHDKAQHWPVLAEDKVVAEYTRDGETDSIAYGEEVWQLDASKDHELKATQPDGRVYTATAKDRDRIVRAKLLSVDFGADHPGGSIVCEGSTNYVIENAATGTKWGQFTGASRGVRHAEIQFDTEEGRALSEDQKIFLVWTARRVLESRMVSMTWILTLSLILLIAYLAWVWIL